MTQDIAVAEVSRRIFRYWWIPVLLAVIGLAVGVGAARTVPAPHRAQATVLVGSTAGSITHSSTIKASQDLASFYADMARREVVLRPVAQRLNLHISWDLLRNQVSAVVPPQNLRLVQITVVAPKEQDSMRIADAVARELVIISPPLPGGNEQAFVNNQVTHLKATIADGEAEVARLKDVLAHTSDAATQDDIRKQIRTQQRLVGYWQRAYVELISVEPSSDAGGLQILDSANPVSNMDRSALVKQAAVGAVGGAAIGLVIAWILAARRAREDGVTAERYQRPSAPSATSTREPDLGAMRPTSPVREPGATHNHVGGVATKEKAGR